ncbi:hypothetical protein ACROSR_13795 [Roseovarius tibetensis]|uniref:hypothetical protein n=1 Tax=Roseovarius tibetensis TaxID=2685897 RepID=UPI003D7F6546
MRLSFTRRTLLRLLAGTGLVPGAALPQGTEQPDTDLPEAGPMVAQDGTVLVRGSALSRNGPGGRLLARVRIPKADAPVLGPETSGAAQRLLRRLVHQRRAAGNHGDLYENRDRGHSRLPAEAHPQLTHVAYDAEMRAARLDYGLAGPVIFDAPLIGNSSTALKHGRFWRSLPRLALTREDGPRVLYQNYLAGQIHVYPEHRDHDPDHGDLIPANTPFFLISQGSSYSDRPHLRALAMILASLRPETKSFLRDAQLLAPTVQMVFRRSLTSVRGRESYRSGLAHPSAIPADEINLTRMVGLANALTPETVPPMVRLAVLSETRSTEGIDYFGEGLDEWLFDTPAAIARIWRGHVARRSMVVSVEATRDMQGRAPDFAWRVLRGDPARTRVEPLGARGARARITLDWQEPRPVPGRPDIRSDRVDIGVFARIGDHDSMPGLISILLPQHETRRYGTGPDGEPRIESRDFRLADGVYADPVLFPRADWRDIYRYDPEGRLTGWRREGAEGPAGAGGPLRFDAAGRLITDHGPVVARHMVERPEKGAPRLVLRTGSRAE